MPRFPDYFIRQRVNIPESGNHTPDLLDEMYYNLKWMLTMQDPADGGVYHKLTTPSFEGFINLRSVGSPLCGSEISNGGIGLCCGFGAGFCLVYSLRRGLSGLFDSGFTGCRTCLRLAEAHPQALYHQDLLNKQYQPAVVTGAYGDRSADDEFFWAASELYLATGKPVYREQVKKHLPTAYKTSFLGQYHCVGRVCLAATGREYQGEDVELANA